MLRPALTPAEYEYVDTNMDPDSIPAPLHQYQKTTGSLPEQLQYNNGGLPSAQVTPTSHYTTQASASSQEEEEPQLDLSAPEFVPSTPDGSDSKDDANGFVGDENEMTLINPDTSTSFQHDLEPLLTMRKENAGQLEDVRITRAKLMEIERKRYLLDYLRNNIITAIENDDEAVLENLGECIQELATGPDASDLAEFLNNARDLLKYGREARAQTKDTKGRSESSATPTSWVLVKDSPRKVPSSYFPDEPTANHPSASTIPPPSSQNDEPKDNGTSSAGRARENELMDTMNIRLTELEFLKAQVAMLRQMTEEQSLVTESLSEGKDWDAVVEKLRKQHQQLAHLHQAAQRLRTMRVGMEQKVTSQSKTGAQTLDQNKEILTSMDDDLAGMAAHLDDLEQQQKDFVHSRPRSRGEIRKEASPARTNPDFVEPLLGRLGAASVALQKRDSAAYTANQRWTSVTPSLTDSIAETDRLRFGYDESDSQASYEGSMRLNATLRERLALLRSRLRGKQAHQGGSQYHSGPSGISQDPPIAQLTTRQNSKEQKVYQSPAAPSSEQAAQTNVKVDGEASDDGLLSLEAVAALDERAMAQIKDIRATMILLARDYVSSTSQQQRERLQSLIYKLQHELEELEDVHRSATYCRVLIEKQSRLNGGETARRQDGNMVSDATSGTSMNVERDQTTRSCPSDDGAFAKSQSSFFDRTSLGGTESPLKEAPGRDKWTQVEVVVTESQANLRLFETYKDRIYDGAAAAIETHRQHPYYIMQVMSSIQKLQTPYGLQRLALAAQDICEEEKKVLNTRARTQGPRGTSELPSQKTHDGVKSPRREGPSSGLNNSNGLPHEEVFHSSEAFEREFAHPGSESTQSPSTETFDAFFEKVLSAQISTLINDVAANTFDACLLQKIGTFVLELSKAYLEVISLSPSPSHSSPLFQDGWTYLRLSSSQVNLLLSTLRDKLMESLPLFINYNVMSARNILIGVLMDIHYDIMSLASLMSSEGDESSAAGSEEESAKDDEGLDSHLAIDEDEMLMTKDEAVSLFDGDESEDTYYMPQSVSRESLESSQARHHTLKEHDKHDVQTLRAESGELDGVFAERHLRTDNVSRDAWTESKRCTYIYDLVTFEILAPSWFPLFAPLASPENGRQSLSANGSPKSIDTVIYAPAAEQIQEPKVQTGLQRSRTYEDLLGESGSRRVPRTASLGY
ncbi:hypothetical protein HDV00_012261 [Rhizophlyctis rosea]|nr:hypothetical protein HDV00_012261 [Rhizophlyctis rosea]